MLLHAESVILLWQICLSGADAVCERMVISVNTFSMSGRGIGLVFHHYKIPRGTPSAGALNNGGAKNLRFSTEISVYLGNGGTR